MSAASAYFANINTNQIHRELTALTSQPIRSQEKKSAAPGEQRFYYSAASEE